MNAQQIIKFINEILPHVFKIEKGILKENEPILDEIFKMAEVVKPCIERKDERIWEFWLSTDRGSFEEFSEVYKSHFTYIKISELFTDSEGEVRYDEMREMWPVYYPDKTVWFHLHLVEFEGNRALVINQKRIINMENNASHYDKIDMSPLLKWILDVEKQCIQMIKDGTYADYIAENLPYKHRSGVTKLETYWKYVPEDKERLFGKIDPAEMEEFVAWDKDEEYGWTDMTSNDYFRICSCLYDILDYQNKFPMHKKDAENDELTPKERYMCYAANYSSAKPFKELDGDSSEAFDIFVKEGDTEHHTWEVCLVPNIHLYPKKINGKYYVDFYFDHKVDDYDRLIHLTLELRKKGIPVIKPVRILERMQGRKLISIEPESDEFDWRYARDNNIYTFESRRLPMTASDEMIKEIQWFPTKKWDMV